LDRIGAATLVATAARSANVLTVSTSDGFAGRWLVPRLYRFHRDNRAIDVRLATSGVLADFIKDGIDIAIRYGAGGYEGVVSELLAEEDVFTRVQSGVDEGRASAADTERPQASHIDP